VALAGSSLGRHCFSRSCARSAAESGRPSEKRREEKRTRYEGAELVVRVLRDEDEDELATMVAQSLPSTGAAPAPSRGTARTRAARMNRGVVKVIQS
jgi:hypothetical protein